MRKVVLALAAGLAASVPAVGAPVVALQDDQITNDASPTVISARADTLASTGTRVTRINVDWSLIAPTRPSDATNPDDPAYRWSAIDTTVEELHRRGIAAMVVLYGTPPWASPSAKWNAAPHPGDFGRFAGAVALRYNGSWPKAGGGVLPEIRTISPGNEPNLDFWLTPQCRRQASGRWVPDSPRVYAAMLKASYARIKASNPRVLILAGETLAGEAKGCSGPTSSVGTLTFIKLLHRALGGGRDVPFDVWAAHLHPVGPPDRTPFFPSWSTLPRITREVNRMHPRGRMPIAVTETSYTTAYSAYHRYVVTEAQQARWLDLTYRLAARQPQVEIVVWFNLQDNWDWPAGLFREDWSPKPSFGVFRRRAILNGVTPSRWALP